MSEIPDLDAVLNSARMAPDEAEQHSRDKRATFEDSQPVWRADYDALVADDWSSWYDGPAWNKWRIAAYVAWSSCEGVDRWPKTVRELAQVLGWSSAQQLRKYRRKYPEIDELARENVITPLFDARARVLATLTELAQQPDYKTFKDRELFLKLSGVYQPSEDLTIRAVTADDMARAQEAAQRELEAWTATIDEEPGDDDGVE